MTRIVLAVFFVAQVVVAGIAYVNARTHGHAARFGWQMYTGHAQNATFTLVQRSGEKRVAPQRVLFNTRAELLDDVVSDDRVFTFLCRLGDDVVAARVSTSRQTRTEQCAGR